MIQKLTLSAVSRFTTKQDGTPLKTKDGKPYTSVRIKAVEHGENWLSGFGGAWNDNWKEGDEVTVEVTKKESGGKTYLNFSRVNTESHILARLEKIENTIALIKPMYEEWKKEQEVKSKGYAYPEPENEDPLAAWDKLGTKEEAPNI